MTKPTNNRNKREQRFLPQRTQNVLNKIIEENLPNLKNEMAINVEEAYRTPNRLDQKIKSSHHIIINTVTANNKEY